MILQIKSFEDTGNLEKERIIFKAISDGQIGSQFVMKTKKMGATKVAASVAPVLWLPDHEVKKGDLVVLYTKTGTTQSRENDGGNTSHFIYWGESKPLFSNNDDAVVLLSSDEWTFKFVGK